MVAPPIKNVSMLANKNLNGLILTMQDRGREMFLLGLAIIICALIFVLNCLVEAADLVRELRDE